MTDKELEESGTLSVCAGDIPGYEKIIAKLRNLCSRREYCSSDILKKAEDAILKQNVGRETALNGASLILESLKNDGYVDDRRYSAAYAREKSSISGWGPSKIRYALSIKKIDKTVIENAFDEIDDSSADVRLKKLLENKYKSLKDDPQYRLKIVRFALGRGYSYDKVIHTVKEIERSQI